MVEMPCVTVVVKVGAYFDVSVFGGGGRVGMSGWLRGAGGEPLARRPVTVTFRHVATGYTNSYTQRTLDDGRFGYIISTPLTGEWEGTAYFPGDETYASAKITKKFTA